LHISRKTYLPTGRPVRVAMSKRRSNAVSRAGPRNIEGKRPEYVSDAIIRLMKDFGVEYVAFNPGATFRAIHDSIVNYGGNTNPEIVLCCHENVAVYIAQGYARATGKPMAAIAHNVVGLMNATNAIYHAWCSREPVIILGGTGPMNVDKRRPRIDWIHTALVQGNLVRDYVKWDDQPEGATSALESFIRGYRIATTEPCGPVYLCYDIELQQEKLPSSFRLPDVRRYPNPRPYEGEADSIKKISRMLLDSSKPVILADLLGRKATSVQKLVAFAELLSIPVVDLGARFNFPNTNPLDLTGARKKLLREADVVLSLDVEDLEGALSGDEEEGGGSLVRSSAKLIQVGLTNPSRGWSQDQYRLQAVDLNVPADTSLVLDGLISLCKGPAKDARLRGRLEERFAILSRMHDDIRKRAWEEARAHWNDRPISTARLAAEVWDAVKKEDWVIAGGNLNGWARKLWDWSKPYQYLGKSGAGSAGYGLSSALGAALAYRDTGKLCVDLQPDGDLLYFSSALWTAAYSKIPMLVVMFNNRSYYNDVIHQENVARARGRPVENKYVGMNIEPPVDFASLARAFKAAGFGPVEDPDRLGVTLREALAIVKKERRVALVDALTQFR
jgi:acetolactate synthase I/II/III large subunit